MPVASDEPMSLHQNDEPMPITYDDPTPVSNVEPMPVFQHDLLLTFVPNDETLYKIRAIGN